MFMCVYMSLLVSVLEYVFGFMYIYDCESVHVIVCVCVCVWYVACHMYWWSLNVSIKCNPILHLFVLCFRCFEPWSLDSLASV